jgi:hypothetical protein
LAIAIMIIVASILYLAPTYLTNVTSLQPVSMARLIAMPLDQEPRLRLG